MQVRSAALRVGGSGAKGELADNQIAFDMDMIYVLIIAMHSSSQAATQTHMPGHRYVRYVSI